jgi:hypothetical protein
MVRQRDRVPTPPALRATSHFVEEEQFGIGNESKLTSGRLCHTDSPNDWNYVSARGRATLVRGTRPDSPDAGV